MIHKRISTALLFILVVGCNLDIGPDKELEAKIAEIFAVEEVVAMSSFGQVVVNISSSAVFALDQADRGKLALALAYTALELHPDTRAILIGFAAVEPEIQQVAYTFENEEGKLSQIDQLASDA